MTEHGCTETASQLHADWATVLRAVLKQLLQPLMTEQASCMWFLTPHMWFFAPHMWFLSPCMWLLAPQGLSINQIANQFCHTDVSSYSTWPNHAESSIREPSYISFLSSWLYFTGIYSTSNYYKGMDGPIIVGPKKHWKLQILSTYWY